MKNLELYRCRVCKLQLEVVAPCACDSAPVCCGEAMQLQTPNTTDAAKEKHVPVVTAADEGILVKVGSVEHPMTAEHFIEWIEVIDNSRVERCFLKPGDLPQAAFPVAFRPGLQVRISCNLHGVWSPAE